MNQTITEYNRIIAHCRELFVKKTHDYGTSWRILRLPSITDQIYIKAQRIRSIQEKGAQRVADGVASEFIGIINYSIMALIQLQLPTDSPIDLPPDAVTTLYDEQAQRTLNLLMNKNHDYGEAWREMRVSSMTDIILMKLLRIKQIEDHQGRTLVSEGVDANYGDIINYSVFCLIKLNIFQNEE